ncbi:MAG: glycosyltransferase family 2 protein [Ktedonobacterales bacterium]
MGSLNPLPSLESKAAHDPPMRLSLIIPVHNQADHIEDIVTEYAAILSKVPAPCEIILVLNSCRDRSVEVCEALAKKHPCIHLIVSEKGGWGLAIRVGIQAARGDLICYTNSARTTQQDLLLMLLYASANPNVVIKANRKVREGLLRRLGSLLYNLECRSLFDLPYWDVNGTPKVFPRAFSELLELRRNDDLIDAEFIAICHRAGYPMLEVPIFSTRRHGGKSTTNLWSACKMYVGAWQLRRNMRKRGK